MYSPNSLKIRSSWLAFGKRYAAGCIALVLLCHLDVCAMDYAPNSKSWAMLIGVERYERARPLRHISNDVLEISDALTRRGMHESGQVVMLYDKAKQGSHKPTKQNLEREIVAFLKRPAMGDHVILYFSGHGFRDEDGILYLAPIDCDPNNPAETGIAASWLRSQLADCKASAKLLILDACHAGSEEEESDRTVSANELGNEFRGLDGVATIASCSGDQFSLVWEKKGQSLFSYWLAQALKGHADSEVDGTVSFDEVYTYTYGQVRRVAASMGFDQEPVRIIRSGTPGDPIVNRLRPQGLDAVLSDMAERIAWAAEFDGLNPVGVLEFTGSTNSMEMLGGDFGMLGKYCAEKINNELQRLGAGRFDVVDQRRLHEALDAQKFAISGLASTKSMTSLAKSVGGMPALVRGTFLNRDGALVNIRAEIIQTGAINQPATAGGVALLNESEWAMLGLSAVSPDRNSPEFDPQQKLPRASEVIPYMDQAPPQVSLSPSTQFPFSIRVMIVDPQTGNYMPREAVPVNGKLAVPLRHGEIYQIWIDYPDLGLEANQPAFLRLLVDGRNSHAERSNVDSSDWVIGKRVNLADAHCWVLDPKKQRTWGIKGFYHKPLSAGPLTPYNEFVVSSAHTQIAERTAFSDELGIITAAFYRGKKQGVRLGPVQTLAGEERQEKVKRYRGNLTAGDLIGVINLHYFSPDSP